MDAVAEVIRVGQHRQGAGRGAVRGGVRREARRRVDDHGELGHLRHAYVHRRREPRPRRRDHRLAVDFGRQHHRRAAPQLRAHLRRHRRDLHPRPSRRGGEDHAADAGHHRGAPVRERVRHGGAQGDRRQARHIPYRGCLPGPPRRAPGADRRVHGGHRGHQLWRQDPVGGHGRGRAHQQQGAVGAGDTFPRRRAATRQDHPGGDALRQLLPRAQLQDQRHPSRSAAEPARQARRVRREQGPQRPEHHRGPVGSGRDSAPGGEAGRPPHLLEPWGSR